MTENQRETGKVWDRLFDHKAFTSGEILFTLQNFEQTRNDIEVAHLFSCIENVTEIKGSKLNYLKKLETENLTTALGELEKSLTLCNNFQNLEAAGKDKTKLEESRTKRNNIWEQFIDKIKSSFVEVDSQFEAKTQHLDNSHKKIETQNNGH